MITLLYIQIILGAFVSGLDAGRIYQTWPLMDLSYFPEDVTLDNIRDIFNFDNHGLIQFYHRNFAYLIVIYISLLGYFIVKRKMYKLLKSFFIVYFFLIIQILLGIFTLISGLNINLASAHQICSLALIISVINLYYNYIN